MEKPCRQLPSGPRRVCRPPTPGKGPRQSQAWTGREVGGWFLGSREGTGGPSSPPFKSGWSYLFGFTAFPPGAPFPVP